MNAWLSGLGNWVVPFAEVGNVRGVSWGGGMERK